MTPERVLEYSRLITGSMSPQSIRLNKDGSWHEPTVTKLIRQAVNEALEEVEKEARERAQRSFLTDDEYMEGCYDAAEKIANVIDALKLPEE